MHTVRKSSLIILLTAFALLLGIITPSVAQADEVTSVPWPLELQNDMLPGQMVALGGNDGLALLNCSNTQQASSFEYLYEGTLKSALPQYNSNGGVSCGGNQGLTTPDGTFYTTYVTDPSSNPQPYTFVAMKNGRILWQTDVSSDPGTCSQANGSRLAWMTFASQGSNGNIYGIVQSVFSHCATYLAEVNSTNGQVLSMKQLTTDGSGNEARLWLYGDKLLTVDYTGKLRQWDYNLNEDATAAYQFPSTWGTGAFYANASGRVFMVAMYDYSGSSPDTYIAYRDLDGTTGSGATGLGVNPPNTTFVPGGNGTLVAYYNPGTIQTFSFTSSGVTSSTVTLALPSGATSQGIHQYWQDQNGNAVVTRQLANANGPFFGVSVDRIDGATGVVTNLLTITQDSAHPNPWLRVADVTPDGSYLYAMVCHDANSCPNSASTTIDEWIHKIPLPNFGAPVKDTGSFTTYTNPSRTYAALGDSFSSGEGNPPFYTGTDTSNDQCHRSGFAYPALLPNQITSLSLTDFVACSGATTNEILNDNTTNNEQAQINALDDRTKVVTLTIGGNDIGFNTFATACYEDYASCAEDTSVYATTVDSINNTLPGKLKTAYEQILQAAPNAQVYVADYPYVVPVKQSTDPEDNRCGYLWWSGAGEPAWADAQAARDVITKLDVQISTEIGKVQAESATYGAHLHYVPTNDTNSPFAGHAVCDTGSSYFNNINTGAVDSAYVFHPNSNGQAAYAQLFASAIGAG